MAGVGKRKPPAAAPGGKRAAKTPVEPKPESESEEASSEDDDQDVAEDEEEGSSGDDGELDDELDDVDASDDEPVSENGDGSSGDDGELDDELIGSDGSDDEPTSENDDDGEASSSLDELDNDAFDGDDREVGGDDGDDDGDSESDGADDDEFDEDDFSDGDGDDDGEDGEDDEDTVPSRKRTRGAAASTAAARAEGGGAAAFGFARAFANLVGDEDGAATKRGGSELLPKTKKQKKVEIEQKLDRRARSLLKRERLELRERGHHVPKKGTVDPIADQTERRMLQTATKGVVRLFNAVSKAQKTVADAGTRKGLGKVSKELTKGSFLQELKKSNLERSARDEAAAARDKEKNKHDGAEKTESAGWDVLSDGYLMGRNKLKDWDKGTRKAEEEVEYEDDDFD
jgi:hypothetical protein